MAELLAKDIMTKKVITVSKDATVGQLTRLLLKNRISGTPVINEKNDLVGIVCEKDVIVKMSSLPFPMSFGFAFLDNYEIHTKSTREYLETKVEEIMSKKIKTVRKDMLLSKVVNIMINNNLNRVPVVDDNNRLSGIITRADIMKSMIKETGEK
ncbi:MAG: CBS domain-containing protein [Actinomycetota bacterium]|nr:CBS domain-containing protein [Actinomycetota bacterium]